MNRLRLTYVMVDITTFLITPITQQASAQNWLDSQNYININQDFSPNADRKCMLGIASYAVFYSDVHDYNVTMLNSTLFNLTYSYSRGTGNNLLPSLFCFGFCKQGTGRSTSNVCQDCPAYSLTCSNSSYALACSNGYYNLPTVVGRQKCFFCLPGCKICTNYTFCIECEPTNLPTIENKCNNCQKKSRLAGGICSSVPGCSFAESVEGKSVCRLCRFQDNFQMKLVNRKCVCKIGY